MRGRRCCATWRGAVQVSGRNPVLIDSYLQDAIEVDVDAVADRETSSSPASWSISRRPASIPATPPARCRPIPSRPRSSPRSSARPARWPARLDVVGLMNMQFAVKGERHLRARGQSPRQPHRALRRQGDRRADRQDRRPRHGRRAAGGFRPEPSATHRHIAVKEAVFPFARFPGVDIILGPEMKSTGEVMGLDFTTSPAPSPSPSSAPACSLPRRRHGLRLGQGQGQGGA